MSLYLGSEVFDIMVQPMQHDNHLFLRQGAGLQGHAVFKFFFKLLCINVFWLSVRLVFISLHKNVKNMVYIYKFLFDIIIELF